MQFQNPALGKLGFWFIGHRGMADGKFEQRELSLASKLVSKVSWVVKIGANIGYYTCVARRASRRVISFEPMKCNYDVLLRNLRANKWTDVEFYPLALSEKPGIVPMYGYNTMASLVSGWAGASDRYFELVPSTSLDLLLGGRLNGETSLFIVDVEGSDLSVLRGVASS